jgi:hypothetical protein
MSEKKTTKQAIADVLDDMIADPKNEEYWKEGSDQVLGKKGKSLEPRVWEFIGEDVLNQKPNKGDNKWKAQRKLK